MGTRHESGLVMASPEKRLRNGYVRWYARIVDAVTSTLVLELPSPA